MHEKGRATTHPAPHKPVVQLQGRYIKLGTWGCLCVVGGIIGVVCEYINGFQLLNSVRTKNSPRGGNRVGFILLFGYYCHSQFTSELGDKSDRKEEIVPAHRSRVVRLLLLFLLLLSAQFSLSLYKYRQPRVCLSSSLPQALLLPPSMPAVSMFNLLLPPRTFPLGCPCS